MDKKITIDKKNLIRPLLNHQKEDLIFISKNVFDFYVDDPTNNDEKYKRIKIRKLMKELQNEGLDKKKFLKTINNLKYSNMVVNFYVKRNIEKNTFFSKKNKQLIIKKNFFKQPYEVIFRALSESIKSVSKNYYLVRGKKIDKIISDIDNNQSFVATLGGCIIEKVNQTVIISKEH